MQIWQSDCKLCRSDLNNSGRGPSRRVPHWREGPGCPASDRTRDAGARFSCGLPCQGVRCRSASGRTPTRIDRGQTRDAATDSIKSAGPRSGSALPSPRAGGLPQRPGLPWASAAGSAALRHSNVGAPPTKRDDDQGPTAAPCSLTHRNHNSLPRRPRQRRGLLGPRRVCRTRLKGNR